MVSENPDMAMTKCPKILEAIAHSLFAEHVQAPGTRNLNTLINGLNQGGHLPRKILALAQVIRELGNVGSHPIYDDETLSHREALLALAATTILLEWHVRVGAGRSA
jgi:hypothetical protein